MTASFVTDTATMCVFDLDALKHRLADDADWWSIQDEELIEVNQGNVAFVCLNDDGKYEVDIVPELSESDCELKIRCPSGRIFLGAGEEVTSDGLEPECIRGGTFLDLPVGVYRVAVKRLGINKLCVAFTESEGASLNAFTESCRI